MSSKFLIIGATGALGYSVTKAVQESGETATLLVRNRAVAVAKFGDLNGLTIVEGDVNDEQLLKELAAGTQFIFHGANVPYQNWAKAMPVMTRSVIAAAEHSGATIIFPGNNYNYGQIDQPINEITPFNPNTSLGKTRVELERMLQLASDQGRIRTLVVRLAELWGPNVTNKQFAPVFENAPKGKPLPWMIATNVPQQLLYSPDAGRAIVRLTGRQNTQAYEVFNIGGTRVASMDAWLKTVGDVAGKAAKISVIPKAMLSTLGLFIPLLRSVRSLAYKFETSIILNDDRFTAQFPDFRMTPMREAIRETLDWFAASGKNGGNLLDAGAAYSGQ